MQDYEPPVARTEVPHPAAPDRSFLQRSVVGWALAVLPIPTFGLLTFVPLLRCALIRPQQRSAFVAAALGLETVGVAALMTAGSLPENATGTDALVSGLAVTLCILSTVVATVIAVLFRAPVVVDLNRLPAGLIARRAHIPLHEAEQVVAQRELFGGFDSVEHAIDAADVSEDSALKLLEVGTV